MSDYIYSFEELEPYPGFELFVYGEAEVFYSRQGAEPDLGILHGYYEYEIGKVWINSHKDKGQRMEVQKSDPLYEAIVSRLTSEKYDSYVQESIDRDMMPFV